MYDVQRKKHIALYQDNQFVTDIHANNDFFAEFGLMGSWYKSEDRAKVGIQQVFFANVTGTLPSIKLLHFLLA